MRPTSIIFLIIALVLIIAGSVTCIFAQRIADENGINLFYQQIDSDSNAYEEKYFSSNDVNKITLNLKDADVYIVGGAAQSYIRYNNFAQNTYELITSNRNLTFNDDIGIFSLIKISGGGFSFSGFRQYINFDRFAGKRKSIEIYISNEDDIKQFEITVEQGNVTVSSLRSQADFNITVEEGKVSFDTDRVSGITASITKGDFVCRLDTIAGTVKAVLGEGDATVIIPQSPTLEYKLVDNGGKISLFGAERVSPCLQSASVAEGVAYCIIENSDGNITVEVPAD